MKKYNSFPIENTGILRTFSNTGGDRFNRMFPYKQRNNYITDNILGSWTNLKSSPRFCLSGCSFETDSTM